MTLEDAQKIAKNVRALTDELNRCGRGDDQRPRGPGLFVDRPGDGGVMITENPRRFIVYSCTLCDFNSMIAKEAADHNCPKNPDDLPPSVEEVLDRLERVAFPSDFRPDLLRRDIEFLRTYITGKVT